MTIWFNKISNGEKMYLSKSITIRFLPQHWKIMQWKSNGALKGIKEDKCYDLNIYFLGFYFSYTNWSYNRSTS
jgi:hypothetical protein